MQRLPSLAERLALVSDPRQASKVQHPLAAILLQLCFAVLCGAQGPRAIAEWGRLHAEYTQALGYERSETPCAATFSRVLRRLDWEAFAGILHAWAREWTDTKSHSPTALAMDGKTLRGSRKRGARGCHILSMVLHDIGLVWSEAAVDDKTNEIPVAEQLAKGLRLDHCVVTVDALLTQRGLAQAIRDSGGDYLMPVKDNHPALRRELMRLFEDADGLAITRRSAQTIERNRGRWERRRLTVSPELGDYIAHVYDWPNATQAYHLQRETTRHGQTRRQVEVGLTSLDATIGSPEVLLRLRRQHWHIENRNHRVRDVTYDEDRSQVRCGATPRVLATVRACLLGFLRLNGVDNVARATRRFAAKPQQAWQLRGLIHS